MPSPFPGMDPYLEHPIFWSEFHSRLILAIANAIAPGLRPEYYVSIETRTYLDDGEGEILVGIPDTVVRSGSTQAQTNSNAAVTTTAIAVLPQPRKVKLPTPIEVKERFLQVREVRSNLVITVVEVLSPKNKRGGEGRESYLEKRQAILESQSHLVEIDLLRSYQPMPMSMAMESGGYRILVSRSHQRPIADLYEFGIREPIPVLPLPLKADAIAVVDLQALMTEVYDQASYDVRIDYGQPIPSPSLSEADQQWVQTLLNG